MMTHSNFIFSIICLSILFPLKIQAQSLKVVRISSDPTNVDLGKTLLLNATYNYTGSGAVGVVWRIGISKVLVEQVRGGNLDIIDSRASLEGRATLVLKNTTLSDNGTYTLKASIRGYTTPDETFTVIIQVKSIAKITCAIVNITEGENFTCICSGVGGSPPPTANWLKDNNVRAMGYRSAPLDIRNISKKDTGTYICRVKSGTLPDEQPVNITVFEMSDSRVKDGLASWIYLTFTVCAIAIVVGLFDCYGITLVIFVEYFQETSIRIGWVCSIAIFLSCATCPLGVFLYRRFGFRPVIIVSAVMFSLTYISTPFVPTFGYLFLTFSIPIGICVGFMDTLTVISLREYFDKYLGLAIGIRFAVTGMGSMLFSYLYPILIGAIGWKKTFFCFSSLCVLILAYSMAYSKPASRQEIEPDKILATDHQIEDAVEVCESSRMSYKFLRNRGFQLVVIGSVPFVFVVGSPAMFIVMYAKALGYPLSKSKWLLVGRGIGSLIGRAGIGYIGDMAVKRRKVSYIAEAAAILFGISSGLCSLTQSLLLMILYMSFIGCMEGIYWVILPLMMHELTFGQNADYAYSMMILITAFGHLSGPPTMGWVYDVTGDFRYVLYAVCAGTTTAGVVMAFGTYLTLRQAASTHAQMTEDKVCLEEFGTDDLKLLDNNIPSGFAEIEKTTIEYETAI